MHLLSGWFVSTYFPIISLEFCTMFWLYSHPPSTPPRSTSPSLLSKLCVFIISLWPPNPTYAVHIFVVIWPSIWSVIDLLEAKLLTITDIPLPGAINCESSCISQIGGWAYIHLPIPYWECLASVVQVLCGSWVLPLLSSSVWALPIHWLRENVESTVHISL